MAIIVEDGTIVANANSFISNADAVTYAANRGITLVSGDVDGYIYKSTDYLETQIYQGSKTDITTPQVLQWPRKDVYIEHVLIATSVIPQQLINAQAELIIGFSNGEDPLAVIERAVKSNRMEPFEEVFMDNAVDTPINPRIGMWLDPLLLYGSSGMSFRVDRSYG